MKTILRKAVKKLMHSCVGLVRTQPWLKRAALAMLYKNPRIKTVVFRALATSGKKPIPTPDRWAQSILTSLAFQQDQHKQHRAKP